MGKKEDKKREAEAKAQAEAEEKRLEAEAKIDAETATRTARFNQDLKERARKLNINPDNFATQKELAEAINIREGELNDN